MDENLEWNQSPAVINETVYAVKEYLDGELAKCETWETSNKSIRCLFTNKTAFQETKTKGVGQTTILKFLGGNWKQNKIQDALALKEDDRKAVEKFDTNYQAREFLQ